MPSCTISIVAQSDPWLSATIAWIFLLLAIFVFVLGYDLWAHFTDHRTMTAQFRDWLQGPITGPVIFALWVAIPVGLTYHFLVK
jgi:hypothetical protein